jgi:uncharacterized protein (DUF362 family)
MGEINDESKNKTPENFSRRDFLKMGLSLGLTAALAPLQKVEAISKTTETTPLTTYPDLVGVKDGTPAQMFELGIKELGGMERFIKKGQKVLVKPNIGWDKRPGEGACTSPDLVGQIIEMALKAGAKEVNVFDNTCNDMNACYKNSGIEEAVVKAGGKMAPGDKEKYYRSVTIPGAKLLKEAKVHELYLDSEVIINVPVLKSHMSSTMTAALKNFMGVVWDRRWWHGNGLHECIADFPLLKKVDLTVIDAYTVMMKNGPRGISSSDLETKKMQILSTDMVLADVAASKILGANLSDIKYLQMANELGIGKLDLAKANIKRISC